MRAHLLAAMLALLSLPAAAETLPPLGGGSTMGVMTTSTAQHLSGAVTRIYPNGSASGTVYFSAAGTCKTNTYFYFTTDSAPGKNWYALLLSAAATSRSIRFAIPELCNDTEHQAVSYLYMDP